MDKNRDYKELMEYYKAEADVYVMFYEDRIRYSETFMALGGVIVSMTADKLSWEQKNGKSDKLKPLQDRIYILNEIYTKLSGLDEKNIRMEQILRDKFAEIGRLTEENEKLKHQLLANEKAFNAE